MMKKNSLSAVEVGLKPTRGWVSCAQASPHLPVVINIDAPIPKI
ncbi:MAG: hypothetical protein ABIJ45_12075 [Candidatus Zixiibacteriota bacterium]